MDQNQKTVDKWVSAILSILIPGVGHMYLGYLGRGLIMTGALILDIALITFSSFLILSVFPIGVALVTVFALALPVIYFYSIFDALQMAERKHTHNEAFPMSTVGNVSSDQDIEWPEENHHGHLASQEQGPRNDARVTGMILIVVGVVLMLVILMPSSFYTWLFGNVQVWIAILLLACGIWLIWKQWDRKGGER